MTAEALRQHINKFSEISSEQFADVLNYFQFKLVAKKENLLSEGQTCKVHYFVLKGILRKFFVNNRGIEQTTEFAIENWWMTDSYSFIHQSPAGFYIQAVEKSEILAISREAYDNLLKSYPLMETYFRNIYQRAYAAAQMRIKFQFEHTREELYHYFRQSQPEFLQRVPQYLIASYLGFTPEYLSEIRKKSIS